MSELQDRIGTTFTHEGFTVRLDVDDDYEATPADDEGMTPRQVKAWNDNEWQYVGIMAKASLEGHELGAASLWGIERGYVPLTDEDDTLKVDPVEYLDVYDEAIRDVISEAVEDARATLLQLVAKAEELTS